ncbi:MAG: xanthine dehydrogenase accessory protein XdhC [Geminicoccaceae bacterium]|nr:MAG: xanthine dehydrogenase accessory protein XdhC [Geminicoccaceae bacterium]
MSAIRITVIETKGSTPREVGASMLVTADRQEGTIGGGELEWRATSLARARLHEHVDEVVAFPLGPELAQCCGGFVRLRLERTSDTGLEAAPLLAPVWLFGAGHVGQALVAILRTLPAQEIVWIDERPQTLPTAKDGLTPVPATQPEALVAKAPAGALLLVMTHSHPRDLAIVTKALEREDLGFLGLIGSRTKRARFAQRLRQFGHDDTSLARLTCPIGLPAVKGKHPAAIAVAVTAQLLEQTAHG